MCVWMHHYRRCFSMRRHCFFVFLESFTPTVHLDCFCCDSLHHSVHIFLAAAALTLYIIIWFFIVIILWLLNFSSKLCIKRINNLHGVCMRVMCNVQCTMCIVYVCVQMHESQFLPCALMSYSSVIERVHIDIHRLLHLNTFKSN